MQPVFPRPIAFAILALIAGAATAADNKVTWDDIANADKGTTEVLSYGLGLKAQRHSLAKKINTKNVDQIVPAWTFSFGGEKQRGQEAQALVHDGIIYVTAS